MPEHIRRSDLAGGDQCRRRFRDCVLAIAADLGYADAVETEGSINRNIHARRLVSAQPSPELLCVVIAIADTRAVSFSRAYGARRP